MPAITQVDTLYRGYSKLYQVTLRGDDGTKVSQQVEDHGQVVAVLAFDPDRGTALLVEVARPAVRFAGHDEEFIEPVAGMIDEGETPEQAARREVMEEVGLRVATLERVGRVFATPGVSTETITLYLAPFGPSDRVCPGGGAVGEDEHLAVVERTLAELWEAVESGATLDGKLVLLLQALKLRRPELFEGGSE